MIRLLLWLTEKYGLPLLLLPDRCDAGRRFSGCALDGVHAAGPRSLGLRADRYSGPPSVWRLSGSSLLDVPARQDSFSANLAKNNYRCVLCGSQGNHLDLWAAATDQNLFDAALDLCKRMDVAVPWIHRW